MTTIDAEAAYRETAVLANKLDQFFTNTKTSGGEPLTEGMVLAAVGQLLAHRAPTSDRLRQAITDLTVAATAYLRAHNK